MENEKTRWPSKLTITSADNPDWNGTCTKNDIELEMNELGLENADWREYVLCHVFDGEKDMTQAVIDALCSGVVRKADLVLSGNRAGIAFG